MTASFLFINLLRPFNESIIECPRRLKRAMVADLSHYEKSSKVIHIN